jgi:hypothetical protein
VAGYIEDRVERAVEDRTDRLGPRIWETDTEKYLYKKEKQEIILNYSYK